MARAKKRKREVIEAPPETPIEEEVPLEPTPPATPPSKKNSARPSLTRTRGEVLSRPIDRIGGPSLETDELP